MGQRCYMYVVWWWNLLCWAFSVLAQGNLGPIARMVAGRASLQFAKLAPAACTVTAATARTRSAKGAHVRHGLIYGEGKGHRETLEIARGECVSLHTYKCAHPYATLTSQDERGKHPVAWRNHLKQNEQEKLLRCDDVHQGAPDFRSCRFDSGDLQDGKISMARRV